MSKKKKSSKDIQPTYNPYRDMNRDIMSRSLANKFGIDYAKENYEFYKDDENFDWKKHTNILINMCATCYKLTYDDVKENIEEAVNQAQSTWKYLWKGN